MYISNLVVWNHFLKYTVQIKSNSTVVEHWTTSRQVKQAVESGWRALIHTEFISFIQVVPPAPYSLAKAKL